MSEKPIYEQLKADGEPTTGRGDGVKLVGVAVVATSLILTACSADGEPGRQSELLQPGLSGEETQSTTDSTTTTTEADPTLTDQQIEARQALIDAGLDPDVISEIMNEVLAVPLVTTEACIGFVEDVFDGGRTEAINKGYLFETADGETRVDTNRSTTAGLGLIKNDGPNMFTDSVAAPFPTDGEIKDRSDVSIYYGDDKSTEEVYKDAMQTAFLRACTDPYELASGMVMAANLEIGNTGVRLGDLDSGVLSQALVDGEITNESMDAMINELLDRYQTRDQELGSDAVENYDITKTAYEAQLFDAARLAVLLDRLAGGINSGAIYIDDSTVVSLGHDAEEFAQLRYSDEGIDSDKNEEIGGKYLALKGEAVLFTGDFKAGCVPINGLALNLLDGRYGYTAVTSRPEGCDPIVMVVTTTTTGKPPTTTTPESTTTTTVPPKNDDGVLPGNSEVTANQDQGTPDIAGNGPAGQLINPDGTVGVEVLPSPQYVTTPTTSAPTSTTIQVSVTTNPPPISTAAPVDAGGGNGSANPETGSLPALP